MAAERFNSNICGPTTALPAFSGVLSGGHVTLASQVDWGVGVGGERELRTERGQIAHPCG